MRTCLFLSVFFCWLLTSLQLFAQTWQEFGIEKGPLTKCNSEMKLLLPLMLDQDMRLKLDKRVWENHELTKEQRLHAEIDTWTERGLDRERAESFAKRRMEASGRFAGVEFGFQDRVRAVVDVCGITSTSGSSTQTRYRSGNLEFTVQGKSEYYRVEAIETRQARRRLVISDDGNGEFQVLLIGTEYLLQIDQRPGELLRVIAIMGDDLFQFRGESFLEFSDKHPERCDHVLKVLDGVGVDAPPLRNSQRVAEAAKKQLAVLVGGSADELEELFAAVDSDEFEVREAAERTLTEDFESYESLIRAKVGQAGTSPHLKSVLNKVIEQNAKGHGDVRALDFLTSQNLLNSPEFLGSLLETATDDEKALIFRQLEKVTGQDFNRDVDALRKYLQREDQQDEQ